MFRQFFASLLNARAVALLRDLEERVAATEDHLESLQRRFDKWSAKTRMRAVREGERPDDASDTAAVAASHGSGGPPLAGGEDRSALRAALRERARLNGLLPPARN